MTKKRVYIAGPDVFLRGAEEYYSQVQSMFAYYDIQGCPPSDGGEPLASDDSKATAFRIYRANVGIIDSCDVVLANINEFRGCEPDSGTCFEIGYAIAKGIPVICYVDDDIRYHERVDRKWGTKEENGNFYDGLHDMFVEQMGLHVNLMIACSTHIEIGLSNAVDHIASMYGLKAVQSI